MDACVVSWVFTLHICCAGTIDSLNSLLTVEEKKFAVNDRRVINLSSFYCEVSQAKVTSVRLPKGSIFLKTTKLEQGSKCLVNTTLVILHVRLLDCLLKRYVSVHRLIVLVLYTCLIFQILSPSWCFCYCGCFGLLGWIVSRHLNQDQRSSCWWCKCDFFFSCLFLSLRDKKEKFKIRIIVCNCSSPQCESTLFRFVMSVVLFFLNYVSSALQLNVSENNKLTENTTYLMDHISV